MNLSVKRIALLFFVASAILSTACDETKEIGLPQGQSLGVSVTDVPINTSTVLVDSVLTSTGIQLLVGRCEDPKLGPVTSNGYFQARFNGAAFTVENATRVDKAELLLPYSFFYGDTTVPYKVSLHLLQLQDSIQNLSSEALPYNPIPVGEATFRPTFARRDTLKIALSDAVTQQLFSFANKTETEFLSSFAGFALVGEYPDNKAALVYPTTSQAFGRIRLSYQTTTSQTYDFLLFNNRPFNHIRGDRTVNPALSGLNGQYSSVSSTATNGETYVQGGTGLMTRIEFPSLTSIPQLSGVAINRAELIVTPLPGSAVYSRSLLILYNATGDGKLLRSTNGITPEYIPGDISILVTAPALAAYVKSAFTFDVTRYVADVLQKRRGNNGLYLSLPSVFNQIQGVASETSLEESINTMYLGGHNHPTAPLKLRIYYTPITAN
jgi:hypothetical protein